ncbi:hypothetical protein PROFUN_13378 [Planoprotostelium fungivorum]|uniref:Uncharacterized protein n=1 Tax=Planoprotostelium fungivorum TaxID=1890364 RepID=A0A2P6MZQ1_9EUKA|nr:hypothetical protein PROFUN_13378 [Planoprotostelium fungivorum]
MSAASLSYQLSRQHQMCNFNKGMLHHSFSIAPAQSTKGCALSVTCRQMSTASSHGNNCKRLSYASALVCNITKRQQPRAVKTCTVRPQAPVLPPVVASPTTQRQSPLYASPLPYVTVRTTQNTPVVDIVHAAQVPNMAPSAVAQPPVILTELDLLTIRQRGNFLAVCRGIVRFEDLSDVDRQEIDRIGALIEAAASRKAKQGHDHKSFNKFLFIPLMNRVPPIVHHLQTVVLMHDIAPLPRRHRWQLRNPAAKRNHLYTIRH